MQQTIVEEKSSYQQALKERDALLIQVQRQNITLKASLRDSEQSRHEGCQLLRLCAGLLLQAGVTVPNQITEYLGN